MSKSFAPASVEEVFEAWEWVEPLLQRIDVEDSGFTTEDVLTRLQMGTFQAWLVPGKAVCLTTMTRYPQYQVCTVLQMAGDGMNEWFSPLMDSIEAWAKDMGCRYVEEYGRRGWERVGKARGYQHAFSVLRKRL